MSNSSNTKFSVNAAFTEAIEMLNPKQKEAVEATEGPVLVVAGPGTGKTQLLAARIGKILETGNADYHNILCLTYTEAGSVAMRNRLIQFIGPDAYNIQIHTFHGFCNQVIREYIQYFGGYRELQLVSELELVDILQEIIDDFDDEHLLKRFTGNIYYERKRLAELFTTMKRENWTSNDFEIAVSELEEVLRKDPKYIYKVNRKPNKKGDLKIKEINKKMETVRKTLAGANEFDKYNQKLRAKSRIDYNDMILWVIKVFQEHEDVLADYQERFQYILVDEYQDTNGSQNDLLMLLTNHWGPKSNIFVVGDDDQSIYRFQGANLQNIEKFETAFDPKIIVLEDNYRSTQNILNCATELISNNADRIVNRRTELVKNLIAKGKFKNLDQAPTILNFPYSVHEEKWVINKILELQENGVPLSEIAVIYPKHKNIDNILKYMEYHNIPVNLKKKINVLKDPEIRRIINILSYVQEEYKWNHGGEARIFELLHYDYFGLSAKDIGKLSLFCSKNTDSQDDDYRWRNIITNEDALVEAGLSEPKELLRVGQLLEEWINGVPNLTVQMLFEKILTQGGIINKVMLDNDDKAWRLQLINTLFDFIKSETSKDPLIGLEECLKMIDQMNQAELDMPLQRIYFAKEGVNLLTAHGSKGLEFEHVFIIKCTQSNWSKGRSPNQFSYPSTLTPSTAENSTEDDRRLFFVAMTRAKSHLYITASKKSEEDKDLEASAFIYELMKGSNLELKDHSLSEEDIMEFTSTLMRYKAGTAELIDHTIIEKVLEGYTMSVTSLNKYLKCPLAFYFENILRVPLGRNASMGFGNAVHHALQKFFEAIEERPERTIGDKEELIGLFSLGMKKYASHFTPKEKQLRTTYGIKILSAYYDQHSASWNAQSKFKVEHPVRAVNYEGVPITGKLDRVDIYDDHVEVYDYKTGKYKNGKEKLKPSLGDDDIGGDYWRQLVFYKMLLDKQPVSNYNMTSGVMDFVEPVDDKFKTERRDIAQHEIDVVAKQLRESYDNIKAHKFEDGCKDDKCKWCDFVQSNFTLSGELEAYLEDEPA